MRIFHYICCMKKTTFVAILLLMSSQGICGGLSDAIQRIESDWAANYYLNKPEQQKTIYLQLIKQASQLAQEFSDAAEPKIWQAILISGNAAYEPPLTALASLNRAKSLLEESISIAPEALDGTALVVLGTLYYKVPGWPISFGDNQLAEKFLKRALKINPDGMDANYFYADYLISQDKTREAANYLQCAVKAPIRQSQFLADSELQKNALNALLALARSGKGKEDKNKLASLNANAGQLKHAR